MRYTGKIRQIRIMSSTRNFVHVFSRDVPVDAQSAFDWMTDYRADDMRFYDAESGSRSSERLAPDKIKLITAEKDQGHDVRIEGIVTLFPPKRWTYTGTMARDAKTVASFDEYFSLDPLNEKTTRFTIRLEAKPLTFGFKLYTTLFRGKLDAWLDKSHVKILQALVSECGSAENKLTVTGA